MERDEGRRVVHESRSGPKHAERVVNEFSRHLRAAVLRLGLRGSDCDEAVQETLARFFDAHARQRVNRPEGWLIATASHVAADIMRDRTRCSSLGEIDVPCAPKPDPCEAKERRRAVLSAIERLEPVARKLIHLRYDEGLCYAEIAERCGVSEHAVRMRLFRVRRLLRAYLGEHRTDF